MRVIKQLSRLVAFAVVLVLVGAVPVGGQPPPIDSLQPDLIAGQETSPAGKLSSNSIHFQETKARAEKGDATAQFELACRYAKGYGGVTQDEAESAKWFRKAAEQGDAGAQMMLGGFYATGRGVPQDYTESAKWFRKAAEQGDADSQWGLGCAYDFGEGVPKDYVEAYKWYNLAAAQNQTNAIHCLDRISESMTPS